MTEIALSTAYFPNAAYCKILSENREIQIDLGEHFVKQSHRSRCFVLGANGVLKLIVPLEKWKNNTPVKDIKISYDQDWQKLHWKTLESAYRSSPYFEYYESKLNALIIGAKNKYLIDLNATILNFVIESLGLDVSIYNRTIYIDDIPDQKDFRSHPDLSEVEIPSFQPYIQVFGESFVSNLSILDLICNEGPNALHLLH